MIELDKMIMKRITSINNNYLKKNFEIKRSNIYKANLGLFTLKEFKKNEMLLYVTGRLIKFENIKEYDKKFPESKFRRMLNSNKVFIIPKKDSSWGFINHNKKEQNVAFTEICLNINKKNKLYVENISTKGIFKFLKYIGCQTIIIEALRDIKKNEELFIDYGKSFDYESAGFKR
jgi:SET domain-containing protein